MKIQTILLGLVLLCISFLAGCQHTASGFGEDMQKNGKAIQNSINGN